MGLLLPQSNSPEAAWITVAEAAARSGLPERTIRYNCKRWSALGKADRRTGEWLISPTVDHRFLATPDADRRAEVLDLRAVTGRKRTVANKRRQVLSDLEAYIAARLGRQCRVELIKAFAAEFGQGGYEIKFGWRTLYNWARRNADAPASGLVDQRGLVGDTREPDTPLKALFEQRWLNSNRLSLSMVYRELVMFSDRQGLWCWNSYSAFRRWVHATYPKAMQCLNREGPDKYRQEHEPCHNQDPEAYSAGECYVGDHHQFRAIVRHRGKLIRPWLTAWMDQRSLAFVGYVVCASPNQHTIAAAYKHAVLRFGSSRICLMDNGRDYSGYSLSGGTSWRAGQVLRAGYIDGEQISGLFGLIQTQAVFVKPHAPNSKIIEGQFKVVEETFVRALPNYCGADPEDRPFDFNARPESSFPTLEEFAAVVAEWIDKVYHHRPSHGKYCQGRSPAEVFAANQTTRTELADPSVLDLLDMQWTRPVKVTRKGIRVNNIYYGEWDPQIIALHGQHVRITYNPSDIGSVGVWSLDHRFICRADHQQLANRNATDEDRRAGFRMQAELRKAMKITRQRSHLAFAGAAEFALAAQQEDVDRRLESRPQTQLPEPATLRLVQTPLDGQSNALRAAFDAPRVDLMLPPEGDILDRLPADTNQEDGYTADIPELPVIDCDEPDQAFDLPGGGAVDDDCDSLPDLPAAEPESSVDDGPHILDLLRRDWDD